MREISEVTRAAFRGLSTRVPRSLVDAGSILTIMAHRWADFSAYSALVQPFKVVDARSLVAAGSLLTQDYSTTCRLRNRLPLLSMISYYLN